MESATVSGQAGIKGGKPDTRHEAGNQERSIVFAVFYFVKGPKKAGTTARTWRA